MDNEPLNLSTIRARLADAQGQQYWRCLEELAGTEGFQEFLDREFPRQASEWRDPISRRQFLKLAAASLALAGLTACTSEPREKILPYVKQPQEIMQGVPLFYTTAMSLGGYAIGLLAKSYMGRPIKIEGNPNHPASLGATDAFAQASLLTLYDPDRSQALLNQGQTSSWDAFIAALTPVLAAQRGKAGAGLRILSETVTSPTLAAQLQALLGLFPAARWYQYEPVSGDAGRAGARLAFGQDVSTLYRFDRATVIVSLDANFLLDVPGRLRYAREFIDGRRIRAARAEMNRLYVAESTPTVTGAMADHRLPMRAHQIEGFAWAIAQRLGVSIGSRAANIPSPVPAAVLDALVGDLQAARGTSIVVAGEEQPPIVHALAHALNAQLGNVGTTVSYTAPVEANPVDQTAGLRELVGDMAAGRVDALLILGGNPAFSAPADLAFADALQRVNFRAYLGLYQDETSALCQWHIPEAHYLESWSDARAFDGSASIIQPLIAPMYGGKTAHELVAALAGKGPQSSYDIVRGYWQAQRSAGDFEAFWRTSLSDGVIAGTALPTVQVTLNRDFAAQYTPPVAQPGTELELIFRPDPTLWDGRFANNGWLQELPKPLTTLTWDNAALLSLNTATRLGLTNEDLVELRYRGRTVNAPVWIMPGHPDESVTIYLGHGRTRAGRVGNGSGFNAYALRTSDAPWFGAGLEIRKLGERYQLARTQQHFSVEGRDLLHEGTLTEFRQNPRLGETPAEAEHPPSLYPERTYEGNAWGMVIDNNACIGCNACVVACQSENNIPVVGKDQVIRSREMHWLKIDQYYKGSPDSPEVSFEPRPCMHCEKAPCEVVCPVAATVHDNEGLNVQVYNRCVGTRYCSNNCPYKVRRFNFLSYTDEEKSIPVLELKHNPEVTVRDRGVMEKCTYCIQRISAARIEAEKADRPIRDGEVLTACQQVCPTGAIVFGNINDPKSQVTALKKEPHNYSLLADLNTQPRTTYLAKLRNPNSEIETE